MVVCIRLALQEGSKGEWATHFSGYVVTLLVIFYLQIANKLPSVLSLQSGITVVKCGGELNYIAAPHLFLFLYMYTRVLFPQPF